MEYLGNGYDRQFSHWYSDIMAVVRPEKHYTDRCAMNITNVVTKQCNFRCSYCYIHGKCSESMTEEVARQTVDFILSDRMKEYIAENKPAVILEFIGGEPLLEIGLIDYYMEYFIYEASRLNHPWLTDYMISMSSNGSLYETSDVQRFIKKYRGRISIAITLDGTKELHDACRVYPDGRGTYDDVLRNVRLYFSQGGSRQTKITIAPENINFLSDAALHMFGLGYQYLYCNVVFEDVWNVEYAKVLYSELKKLADIMLEKELYKNHYISMFSENIGSPMSENENTNWCGGDGSMLAIDPQGNCYPCLRYMDYCFADKGRKPLLIGNVWDGIPSDNAELQALKSITRRSQSTDECFYCPISKGCSWCSAFNYEINGTANKRNTFHCIMQKARVLGNVYYWNKLYRKLGMSRRFDYHMPDEWALEIIDNNEIEILKNLSKEETGNDNRQHGLSLCSGHCSCGGMEICGLC